MQPARAPIADGKCPSEKGVSAKPCLVKLSGGTPEVTVKTTGPKGGKFTVHDSECTARLIATIKGKRGTYKVKAGTHGRGQCVATFVDYSSKRKRLGAAKVIILNDVDEGS
jgi:glycerate-2-kinase